MLLGGMHVSGMWQTYVKLLGRHKLYWRPRQQVARWRVNAAARQRQAENSTGVMTSVNSSIIAG